MRNSPRHNEGLIATDFSATLGEIADAGMKSEEANNLAVVVSTHSPLETEPDATAVVLDLTIDNSSPNQDAPK
jgi:hypothetical protein